MPKNTLVFPSRARRAARTGVVFRPRVEELEPRRAPAGFGPPHYTPVGHQPVALAAVDFFPNRPVDLVAANGGSASFTFLQNRGDGNFVAHPLPTRAPLTGLAVAPRPGVPQPDQGSAGGPDNNGGVDVNCFNADGTPCGSIVLLPPPNPMPPCICQPIALDGFGELVLPAGASHQVLSYGYNPNTRGYDAIGGFAVPQAPVGVLLGSLGGPGAASNLITVNRDSATGGAGSVSVLQSLGGGRYQAPQNFPVGSTPYSVAVGDFNNDGIPDLAVANLSSNDVSILLGNGDGTFRKAITYPVGMHPVSVAVGDFNGDGNLDLAVANEFSNTVSILLGNGDGTFQRPSTVAAGRSPAFVAVGDFNGDGISDLAVADVDSNAVSLLLGNGDGSFQQGVNYAVGTSPESVAVGDFNGDGNLDLAVANINSRTVSVLLGNGDGSFQQAVNYAAGNTPMALAIGDFNGDGQLDLAVTNELSSTVSILLGNGDGSFQQPQAYPVGPLPYSVAVGDFNNDGIPDLAVTTLMGGVDVLLGTTSGRFQQGVAYAAGLQSEFVAVGDFNGDGLADLAVANGGSNNVSVLLGNGDGTFPEAATYKVGREPSSVVLGDFNNDGIPDLAVTNTADNSISILLGKPDGTFQPAGSYSTGNGTSPVALAVASLNDDGILDLVTADYATPGVSVLLGNGNGTFQSPRFFAAGQTGAAPTGVVLADFNGDGLPDLAVSLKGEDRVATLINLGGWRGPSEGARGRSRAQVLVAEALITALPGPVPVKRRENSADLRTFDLLRATGRWETIAASPPKPRTSRRLTQPRFSSLEQPLAESMVDLALREWRTLGLVVSESEPVR